MVHRTAPLTEAGRLRLASVIDMNWPLRRAAERSNLQYVDSRRVT